MLCKVFRIVKVTFFVKLALLCLVNLFSSLNDFHNAVAKETIDGVEVGESKIFQEIDFMLDSPEGALSLKDLRGNVVLLFFGFTSCADVCPISLATISHSFSYLNDDELKKSKSLFISLDPERDTLERLKKYTGYFHPNIIGVTGTMKELGMVAEIFGVKFEKKNSPDSALGYVIYHSSKIFVIDPQGVIRKTIPHNIDSKLLSEQIRSLLLKNQL
mgnify:CR=1 FL=1